MLNKVFSFKKFLYIAISLAMVLNLLITTSSIASSQIPEAYTREIRRIDISGIKNSSPIDLTYWPENEAILVVNKTREISGENSINIVSLYREDHIGIGLIPGLSANQLIIAGSENPNEFFLYDPQQHKSYKIKADNKLYPSQTWPVVETYQFPANIERFLGGAFDRNGKKFLFIGSSGNIISLTPRQTTETDGFSRVSPDQFSNLELDGNGELQRSTSIAVNPNNNHIYILDPVSKKVFESSEHGELIASIDLEQYSLSNTRGIAFAPSGDPTDAPSTTSLYVLDSSEQAIQETDQSQVVEISLIEPVVSEIPQAINSAALVNTILTSGWSPPSPDPAGITYWASQGTLLVSDSEVNEMPPYFTGFNVFQATNTGTLQDTYSTTDFSNEPTGVSLNSGNGHIYYSDDDQDAVFEIDPGADSVYGTSDDVTHTIDTASFDNFDPEGVSYGQGYLFILDGVGSEVYVLEPGNNGIFEGVPPTGDDNLITHFDTASMGLSDPEGIEYYQDNQTLFIVGPNNKNNLIEVSPDGTFISLTDISFLNSIGPAGVAIAPGSSNPGIDNIYISDRGIDNSSDKNENDGKVYEITFQSGATPGPSLTPTNTITVTPTGLITPTAIGPSPTPSSEVLSFDIRIQNGGDDAEENESGGMYITSSDLELVFSNGNQLVGLRFNNVTVPPGAQINSAYLQFKVDETSSVATNLSIQAEASDNAGAFSTTSQDISSRDRTNSSAIWAPVPWGSVGAAGADQLTTNIAAVIQEVIDRAGWLSGNSIGVIISGDGVRVAEAYDGDQAGASLLHIEYQEFVPTNTPTVTATNTISPTPTNTDLPSPTATNTVLPSPTNTLEPTATNSPTSTATDTPIPTSTHTSVPTATNTLVPTSTNTPTLTATNTPLPTLTDTPTATSTNTLLPTSTDTPTATATNTPLPTSTDTPTATATNMPLPTSTDTPTATATNTPLPTSTDAPTATATNTPLPTSTSTPTLTSTSTPTESIPTPTPSSEILSVNIRVETGQDDAEELEDGTMYVTSSDLELVFSNGSQQVGMRFNNIAIPKGVYIDSAYLQFKSDETASIDTTLIISAESNDHANSFSTTPQDISSRVKTISNVEWSPLPWTSTGESGVNQRSPDIAVLIQEVVNRAGWKTGNSLGIIVTGTGVRVAEAYEGDPGGAPLLHIEYRDTVPTLTLSPTSTSTSNPTPTYTPSQTPTISQTPTATAIPSATPTPTNTYTPTPTATNSPVPTSTNTPTPTNTPTITPTPTVTSTPTLAPINLSLNKPVSISSFESSTTTGEYAVDGDLTTYWQSKKAVGKNKTLSEGIEIDLGGPYDILQVVLNWDKYYATSYEIRVSLDRVAWISTYSTVTGDGGIDTIFLGNIPVRFIRMESTAWSNSTFRLQLSEFEVMGYSGNESVNYRSPK